jgi:hypothetical protein
MGRKSSLADAEFCKSIFFHLDLRQISGQFMGMLTYGDVAATSVVWLRDTHPRTFHL